MSSRRTSTIIATLLATISASAVGNEPSKNTSDIKPYIAVSGGVAIYESTGPFDTYETEHSIIGFRAGLKFNQYVSTEFRLGRGSEEQETVIIDANGNNAYTQLDFESYSGAYIRAHIPFNENLSLYGLAGKTKIKATGTVYQNGPASPSIDVPLSESDTSFGLGIEYLTSNSDSTNYGFGLEYIQFGDKDDTTLSGLNLSALVQF